MYDVSVELIDYNRSGEQVIIEAARTCYASQGKSNPGSDDLLIRRLIESGHHAMLEFGWAAFKIRCSRVVSHELVRHRLLSIGMRSQRYVDESNPDYMIPPEILDSPNCAYSMYEQAMKLAYATYQSLVESKVPKQIARYCLPNACMTEMVVAANFREWRHVCKLRCSRKCQPEMQEVANGILRILKEIAPRVFNDIQPTD
jgi:thymidylate synthase (FAD)